MATGGLLISAAAPAYIHARQPRVIIIGAGFAGLAAAYALHKRKTDFVVLEARNRTGGRVFSHTMDAKENLVVELGAEWVGASHKRIIKLCEQFGLTLENNQLDTHLLYRGEYFTNDQWDYSAGWNKKFEQLLEAYHRMDETEKIRIDKMDWWRYLVNNGCDGRDLQLRELLDSTDFGESIRQVSAFAALAEYAESSKKNEMDFKIKNGNSQLAHKFAEKIGAEKIKTGHAVTRIVQNKNGVTVHCSNGAVFTGDKLICTAPTFSVLQIDWQPRLPPAYLAALNELQYARICKNPILFSKKFWPADGRFDMVTDMPAHYLYNATKNQASEKGVLISYTTGDKADVVNNQSDAWRQRMVLEALQPGFGDLSTHVEQQTKYYWGEDNYSRGAYAIYRPGQWFRLMPLLQQSFMHTHFAGEHLAEWQGFMEGAIITGEMAAAEI
jgi:monoamine oxidase